jgi:hypothetical protein
MNTARAAALSRKDRERECAEIETAKALREQYEVKVSLILSAKTNPDCIFPADCFKKALEYVVDHPRTGCVLIHGTVMGNMAHAWVEFPGGIVFDGVRQRFYDRQAFYEFAHAKKGAEFTSKEAARLSLEKGNYGPWRAVHPKKRDKR